MATTEFNKLKSNSNIPPTSPKKTLRGVTGEPLKVTGHFLIPLQIQDTSMVHGFYIVDHQDAPRINILGIDFLKTHKLIYDAETGIVSSKDQGLQAQELPHHSVQAIQLKEDIMIKLVKNEEIPGHCEFDVDGYPEKPVASMEVILEPASLKTSHIAVARTLVMLEKVIKYLEEETKNGHEINGNEATANGPSLQDFNNKEMDSKINESLQEYKDSGIPSNIEIMFSNLIPASTPGEATMEYGQHPMEMDSGLNPSSVRPQSSHKALCAGEGKDGIKTNEVRSDYHLRKDDADTASNSRGPEHVVGADAPNEIDQLMEVTTENNGVGASKISNEQVPEMKSENHDHTEGNLHGEANELEMPDIVSEDEHSIEFERSDTNYESWMLKICVLSMYLWWTGVNGEVDFPSLEGKVCRMNTKGLLECQVVDSLKNHPFYQLRLPEEVCLNDGCHDCVKTWKSYFIGDDQILREYESTKMRYKVPNGDQGHSQIFHCIDVDQEQCACSDAPCTGTAEYCSLMECSTSSCKCEMAMADMHVVVLDKGDEERIRGSLVCIVSRMPGTYEEETTPGRKKTNGSNRPQQPSVQANQ
ncbi:hypothetical protein GQR58_003974 [Nymphon striatum]|nr:hypothetical protein GQR58_003974 [Nymphon striatum]